MQLLWGTYRSEPSMFFRGDNNALTDLSRQFEVSAPRFVRRWPQLQLQLIEFAEGVDGRHGTPPLLLFLPRSPSGCTNNPPTQPVNSSFHSATVSPSPHLPPFPF